MRKARIYVNERGYQGEDLDRLEARHAGLASGFSSHNLGALHALQFGDVAMPIVGDINIKSHLQRILTRIHYGTLDAKRIVIELEDMP